MRLAIDIRCLTDEHLTGVGLYTLNVVQNLLRLAPHIRFFLFASGTAETLKRLPAFSGSNVTVVAHKTPNKLLHLQMVLPFGKCLEDFLPESVDAWFFPNRNIVRTRLPYALTIHDLTFALFPEFFTRKDRLLLSLAKVNKLTQQAHTILAVSENTARDVATHFSVDAQRITITHLGVDTGLYNPAEQPADRSFRLIYDLNRDYLLALATPEPRKNFAGLIEGYDTYARAHPNPPPLVIAGGSGWKNHDMQESLNRAHAKKSIRLLGTVPEKHKPALYRGAAAFLFPSYYEGFGLPVLEAMACGTPVISSFTSSLPEILGDAALYIDPFNVTDITQAITHLLDNEAGPALQRTLKERGLARVAPFTWQSTAQQTLHALEKIVVPRT